MVDVNKVMAKYYKVIEDFLVEFLNENPHIDKNDLYIVTKNPPKDEFIIREFKIRLTGKGITAKNQYLDRRWLCIKENK